VHVFLPLRRAQHVSDERGGRRSPLRLAADAEALRALAVQPHFELVRFAHSQDVVVQLTPQPDFDHVLGVDREPVTDRQAAARPERQILVHPFILGQHLRRLVGLEHRDQSRVADRKPADLPSRRHVPLDERRRYGQHTRDVVEALSVGIVRREERARIDLQPQQIADRVDVLGAIQPMHGNAAGIRTQGGGAIQRRLDERRQRRIRRFVGTRRRGRGHLVGAKLVRHLFPYLGPIGRSLDVERVQRQAAGLQSFVMAGDAVFAESGPGGRGGCRIGGQSGRGTSTDRSFGLRRSRGWPRYRDGEPGYPQHDQPPEDSFRRSCHRPYPVYPAGPEAR
jgi:hypothetical protein